MGGSSGVFHGQQRSPQKIAENLKQVAQESARDFDSSLAKIFNDLLVKYNERDTTQVRIRLDSIKMILRESLDSSIDTLFGGSVAKHTYVDGISDIDSLLVFKEPEGQTPNKLIRKIENILREELGSSAVVTSGNMAITVEYKDGPEIQLVPAVKDNSLIKVPESTSNTWSSINPNNFNEILTRRNDECQGKLIPTLKLVKAINTNFPEQLKLTGYHIESLGVSAFRNYSGARTTSAMLPYFFKEASQLVLRPITDKTGQSVHVDGYLGSINSEQRQAISHALTRLHMRMLNASAAHSQARWLNLFGE